MSIFVQDFFLVDILFLHFWSKILGVEWLNHWIGVYFTVSKMAKLLFPNGCTTFHFHLQDMTITFASHPCQLSEFLVSCSFSSG